MLNFQILIFMNHDYIIKTMQSKQPELITIHLGSPMRSTNLYRALLLELFVGLYYLYLLGSIVESDRPYQKRVLIYCMVFLLLERLELLYQYLEVEDPLLLTSKRRCTRYTSLLCIANLIYLLVRIIIENKNLHAIVIFGHFVAAMALILNNFGKKNAKYQMGSDSTYIFSRVVTPIMMFIFNKTSGMQISDFSYLEFLIFAGNVFLTLQLSRIIILKQCYILGWRKVTDMGKEKKIWSRMQALRINTFVCCGLLVVQNVLLIFQGLRYQISVTLIQTVLVGFGSYYLRVGS